MLPQHAGPQDTGDIDEDARDVAMAPADTPAHERSRHRRKKVEMLFAHLKRILRLSRLRLRGPRSVRDSQKRGEDLNSELLAPRQQAFCGRSRRREAKWRPPNPPPNSRCIRASLQWPISHLALGRFIPLAVCVGTHRLAPSQQFRPLRADFVDLVGDLATFAPVSSPVGGG